MKKGQTKSYGESLIPLILIVILGLFIAAKFGYVDLSGVPFLGELFGTSFLKVIVVGHASPEMEALMKSEDFALAGVTYAGDLPQQSVISADVLKNFDIIIVQGTRICDRPARKALGDAVKSGKKMILIADACTAVSDDVNAGTWDLGIGSLGDVVPATYSGVLMHERTGSGWTNVNQGSFKIIAVDHPMFNGIFNHEFSGTVINVLPKANSDVLAYIDQYAGSVTAPATFGIIESKGFMGGKTLYFAFDPSTNVNTAMGSRNMFMNALLYLKGAKG
ncbi:MAG: hypothetical protein V1834_04975 [Candidatus Micrarchaeota archaeon]